MHAFACVTCQSRSFTLDGNFTESTLARCSQCGATLGSWGQLRRELERRIRLDEDRARAGREESPRRAAGSVITPR